MQEVSQTISTRFCKTRSKEVVDTPEEDEKKNRIKIEEGKSSFLATATFASEASEKMNVDLNRSDFWQKLMRNKPRRKRLGHEETD